MARIDVRKLSFDELLDVKERVDRAIERHAAKERHALERRLASLAKIGGSKTVAGERRVSALAGRRAEPKYRNPNDRSQTWAGRGLQPRWMRDLVEQGHDPEEFAIRAETRSKRSTKKK